MKRIRTSLGVLWATVLIAARRLSANRRMVAGLLLGFVVAVAGASSVPVYTVASLQRMLQLELGAVTGKKLPAAVQIAHFENPNRPSKPRDFLQADAIAREQGPGLIGLPVAPYVTYGSLALTNAAPVDKTRLDPGVDRWAALAFLSDLKQHVTLVDGRWPEPGKRGGVYEVVVEEAALDRLQITLNAELKMPVNRRSTVGAVPVKVVGVFRRTDPAEPYWYTDAPYEQALFVDQQTFVENLLAEKDASAGQYSWYYGIDRNDVQMTDVTRLLTGLYDLESRMAQVLPDTSLFDGPHELLTRYLVRAGQLQLLLLLLAVLPLTVVAYFLTVTSAMMVDGQRQEIAVLRSRGASLWQVLQLYVMEGVLLGGLALAGGYPLGILLARVMGAAAGFLRFVDRTQPAVQLPPEFWLYGLAAVALAVVAYVLPVLGAARESIVSYKLESARKLRRPAWARWGLDLLCLGLAGYGYYALQQRQAVLAGSGATPGGDLMQPLDILAPGLFVLGSGLLALRLVPLLAKGVARLLQHRAGTPLYLTLTQLSRAPGGYTAVVLLLSLTVGMGLYSAAAARTLEQNVVERTMYQIGAEVTVDEGFGYVAETGPDGSTRITEVQAPPWHVHHDLSVADQVARVRVQAVTPIAGGRNEPTGKLMAIDPADFARVAWFRRDMAPAHLNTYLNLLVQDEEAVLVTPGFAQRAHLRPGDRITLRAESGAEVSLVIYATVPYWPSLYPAEADFFIANLDYVERSLGLAPYQVWFKLKEGATLAGLVGELKKSGISVVRAVDARQLLIRERRDPRLGGLLGGLTSGFLLSALIALLGFWLYSALSLRSRMLQFGVLQAMGLQTTQLVGALALEQLITVGLGIGIGTGVGMTAARLFVPFLQQGGGREQVPPFHVVADPGDRLRLYLVMALMLLFGLFGLMAMLRQLKVYEAIKLGEDN